MMHNIVKFHQFEITRYDTSRKVFNVVSQVNQ